MSRKPGAKPSGQLRQSQVITTFGPGAMLDLPNHSVLVGGLDTWTGQGEQISEPRLTAKLQALLKIPSLRLFAPPPDQEDPTAPQTGISAWQFPEWFITQDLAASDQGPAVRSRMLVHRKLLSRGKFIDQDKKKRAVVPVRFVRACKCGHIGDIDWRYFVHSGESTCMRQLWMDERGTSGDLSEVSIRCECKAQRQVGEAANLQLKALGHCDGSRPWLGPFTKESCGEPNRLLIRTANNAYFPQLMSVISLPDRDETVKQAVDAAWEFLEEVEEIEQLKYERKKAKVKAALVGLSDEEVFAEILARRTGVKDESKSVKQAELETLVASKDTLGNDKPDGSFFARTLPRNKWDQPLMKGIERIVLVHRLREVVAQVGFTRFEAASPDFEGELDVGVRRATLAREVSWLPAVEIADVPYEQFLNYASHPADWSGVVHHYVEVHHFIHVPFVDHVPDSHVPVDGHLTAPSTYNPIDVTHADTHLPNHQPDVHDLHNVPDGSGAAEAHNDFPAYDLPADQLPDDWN